MLKPDEKKYSRVFNLLLRFVAQFKKGTKVAPSGTLARETKAVIREITSVANHLILPSQSNQRVPRASVVIGYKPLIDWNLVQWVQWNCGNKDPVDMLHEMLGVEFSIALRMWDIHAHKNRPGDLALIHGLNLNPAAVSA